MDDENNETLNLSKRGLKKIEKANANSSTTIINLILDHNELQRLDNLDTYIRVENLSINNNYLLRMHGVSRLSNLRELSLNNNGILQIEGLKEMTYLKVLKLAGNNIKSIEHLNHNIHLEHLDLSNNQIAFIADISYLKALQHLNLERNRINDLRQCDRYLPHTLLHLGLAHNAISDLNEVSHLVHLTSLGHLTVQGNPCVAMAGSDKIGFDYRPYVLNWVLNVKTIDGYAVSAIESLKAEWLYSQGRGRAFGAGQHAALASYLASTCPLTPDQLETDEQRKLRIILSKAQHHQQQLKENVGSPAKQKLQSPRMQCRISRRSPDRMTLSCHASPSPCHASPAPSPAMTHSYDSRLRMRCDDVNDTTPKPANRSLEAASKMVPVPESLMSPDYQEPIYDLHKSSTPISFHEEKRHIVPPNCINKNMKTSPRPKSATSSPKLKCRLEQRKGSLSKIEHKEESKVNGKVNGLKPDTKPEPEPKPVSNNPIKNNVEVMAAVTIQKMWRGYRSRNLNKDTFRILHAIQAARSRQHIQRLTCDMEATKAALDSERKIQQLQMQAINALWKKVSTIQSADSQKQRLESEDHTEVLKQLTETCFNLQNQVVELRDCMQTVLRVVSADTDTGHRGHPTQCPVSTQTDITAVDTPQEDRCNWLKRPKYLAVVNTAAPADRPLPQEPVLLNKEAATNVDDSEIETNSSIEEKSNIDEQSLTRDTDSEIRNIMINTTKDSDTGDHKHTDGENDVLKHVNVKSDVLNVTTNSINVKTNRNVTPDKLNVTNDSINVTSEKDSVSKSVNNEESLLIN